LSPADPPYTYGSIVLVADMLDPQGRHPKDRPCVVVTQPESTPEGRQLVVAISTRLPDPLPDDHVLLPWQRPHHPKTGLNMRNAAIGRWVEMIDEGRIIRKLGFVPDRPLLALTKVLDRLYPIDDADGEETTT
jgi:mRNA-degrading endonuclease toxin of MazEF toxin-antitoxin module